MPAKQLGLDGRHRDENGRISEKHGNTLVSTLRDIYGPNFLPGVAPGTSLGWVRDKLANRLVSCSRRRASSTKPFGAQGFPRSMTMGNQWR
jgi:hypothetical protein